MRLPIGMCGPRPERVAGAVVVLVVVAGPGRDRLHLGGLEDAVAELRVHPQLHPLVVRELVALQEDLVGDADLAHVVQQARAVDELHGRLVEAHRARDRRRVDRDHLGVVARVRILLVDRAHERGGGRQHRVARALLACARRSPSTVTFAGS